MQELEKECRSLARQIVAEEYRTIDEIWKRRVNYESVAADYDTITIKEISRRMPNLLVRGSGVPLDELADEYGYACCCDLIDTFTGYVNKAAAFESHYEKILRELSLEAENSGVHDVPF